MWLPKDTLHCANLDTSINFQKRVKKHLTSRADLCRMKKQICSKRIFFSVKLFRCADGMRRQNVNICPCRPWKYSDNLFFSTCLLNRNNLPNNLSSTNNRNDKMIAISAAIVSFLTYTMVYGFRKGFTVCSFEGMQYLGISYKVWLVISQVLGYASSKFYGIRFISELKKIGRGKIILLLVSISWAGLLFFALVPAPWNIVFMFINGFPLGIIWGIIFSYVEGRRATDFIGATLSVSFIFSSGFVKTVAGFILQKFNTSEFWLPFVTGFVFSIPLLIAVYFLEKIPPPSDMDMNDRSIREPMPADKRKEFVKMFLPGLIASIGIYVFATVFRDLRDNFMADMLKENGYGMQPALFTKTETPVTIILLLLMSSMILVRNNIRALIYTHYIIIAGFIITGMTSMLFLQGSLNTIWWLTLTGLGLYTVYIPFNCIFF